MNMRLLHTISILRTLRYLALLCSMICCPLLASPTPLAQEIQEEITEQNTAPLTQEDLLQDHNLLLKQITYLKRNQHAKIMLERQLFQYDLGKHSRSLSQKTTLSHSDVQGFLNPILPENRFDVPEIDTTNSIEKFPILIRRVDDKYYDLSNASSEIATINGQEPETFLKMTIPSLSVCNKINTKNPLKRSIVQRHIDACCGGQHLQLQSPTDDSLQEIVVTYKNKNTSRSVKGCTIPYPLALLLETDLYVGFLRMAFSADIFAKVKSFNDAAKHNQIMMQEEQVKRKLTHNLLHPIQSLAWHKLYSNTLPHAKRATISSQDGSLKSIGYLRVDSLTYALHYALFGNGQAKKELECLQDNSDCLLLDLRINSSISDFLSEIYSPDENYLPPALVTCLTTQRARHKCTSTLSLNSRVDSKIRDLQNIFAEEHSESKIRSCQKAIDAYLNEEKTCSVPYWDLISDITEQETIWKKPIFVLVDETTKGFNEVLAATLACDGATIIGRNTLGLPLDCFSQRYQFTGMVHECEISIAPSVISYENREGKIQPLNYLGLHPDIWIDKTVDDALCDDVLTKIALEKVVNLLANRPE